MSSKVSSASGMRVSSSQRFSSCPAQRSSRAAATTAASVSTADFAASAAAASAAAASAAAASGASNQPRHVCIRRRSMSRRRRHSGAWA